MTTIYLIALMTAVAISASLIFILIFNDRRNKVTKRSKKEGDPQSKYKGADSSRYAM